MAYVDLEYVSLVASSRPGDLVSFDSYNPGAFAAIAESVSRIFDARLGKRYATPFVEPYPEALRFNVAQVVNYQIMMKIGFEPGTNAEVIARTARDESLAWLKEAADSKDGLIELPRRELPLSGDANGVSRSRPISYTEASPYTWMRRQSDRARNE